ncbi:MAG: hypothetical protein HY703_09250 [Gemmatimonadetes bacterium]|nr:hypothetical protein [Gemmatimonadota bacterium]
MGQKLFRTALCAVGGGCGGAVVPRWFGVLPELGVECVCLFWAIPPSRQGVTDLDALCAAGKRWLAELAALGAQGELVLKRGNPGPWLTALASIVEVDLVVTGPPATRQGSSRTITHLLEHLSKPLLLLPGGEGPAGPDLLARPLVDSDGTPEARALIESWTAGSAERSFVRPGGRTARERVHQALRACVETDATILVLPGRARAMVPHLLRSTAVPLLVAPPHPLPTAASRRAGPTPGG